MKKLFFVFAALFLFTQLGLKAQVDDEDYVDFNLILEDLLDIEVTTGNVQTITFTTADHWNLGTWEGNGIVDGNSEVTVNATTNWDMTIEAPDFTPGTGTGSVPINNLGVWCEALGTNTFGGANTCSCTDATTSQGLTNAAAGLISNGTGNLGDGAANWFRLNWRMGTMDNGSMAATSMLNQLVAGQFSTGTYSTTATLTVTAVP